MNLRNFFGRPLTRQSKASLKKVAATGLKGEPSARSIQPYFVGPAAQRPESLVGYTGGWATGSIVGNQPAMGSPISNAKGVF